MSRALKLLAPRLHTRPRDGGPRLAATPVNSAERSRQERRCLFAHAGFLSVQGFRHDLVPLLGIRSRQGMLRSRLDEILIFGVRNFVLPAYFLSKNIPDRLRLLAQAGAHAEPNNRCYHGIVSCRHRRGYGR